jgi:hypothetical protein
MNAGDHTIPQPGSTARHSHGLLAGMRSLAALIVLVASLIGPGLCDRAMGGDYSYDNRPHVVFPGLKGKGIVHVSPYPAGKRAASIWLADACWRDCGRHCTWQMETCLRAARAPADICRPQLDACDRACQRACRIRGGPLLGFIDF